MSTVTVVLLGLFGAVVPEVLRVIASLRLNKKPTPMELLASLLVALLGAGVLLFDIGKSSPLEIAVLGSAFPQLFSGLVAAAVPPAPTTRGRRSRRVIDYIGWRLG